MKTDSTGKRLPYTDGMRNWCTSVEQRFNHPRDTDEVDIVEQRHLEVPESFLAYAFKLIRAAADEIDELRQEAASKPS